MRYDPAEIRSAWADASHALWASGIYEEDDDHLDLLRENGWAWAIGKDEDYCGHFHAVSGRYVGDHMHPSMCVDLEVHPAVRRRILPSTRRLDGQVEGAQWSDFPAIDEPEYPHPGDIAKGDIVTVGDHRFGTHIVMAFTAVNPATGDFETIEGNSTGLRADGTLGRGGVKKTRHQSEVKVVYRFGRTCFRGLHVR